MTHTPSLYNKAAPNPLDMLEELLEASDYNFHRETKSRLQFLCAGKQGDYEFVMEWNAEFQAIKCTVIVTATKNTERDILDTAVLLANETAWQGFFMIDGVGNSLYKSILKLDSQSDAQLLLNVEQAIDHAIIECDRFCISLALSDNDNYQDLFDEEGDWSVENLSLMFSDTKGNA